jgi:hypothetical protein
MFQMINDNAGFIQDPSLSLSTVQLPSLRPVFKYESCLFADGTSDVVGRYNTLSEAVEGHNHLASKYKLSNRVK